MPLPPQSSCHRFLTAFAALPLYPFPHATLLPSEHAPPALMTAWLLAAVGLPGSARLRPLFLTYPSTACIARHLSLLFSLPHVMAGPSYLYLVCLGLLDPSSASISELLIAWVLL